MRGSRRNKKPAGEEGAGMERWLLSYADFITLLMVFFILMYAMSKVDVDKYSALAESLNMVLDGKPMAQLDALGPSLVEGISGQQTPASLNEELVAKIQLEGVQKQIEEFIAADKLEHASNGGGQTANLLEDYIAIIEQERGLVISIKDTLLFTSGSDTLNLQARGIIKQLGSALVDIPNCIRVEGHTDNLPINTAKFPSNWELSILRSATVVHVLQQDVGISPDRLSVIGYGEYRPLVANLNVTNQAINRRVDIVILKQKYDDYEPPRVP